MDSCDCIIQGQSVPAELLGPLRECTASGREQLETLLQSEGYVFLRSVIAKDSIAEARQEVFGRLASVDEIKEPAAEGIASGRSRRRELHSDLGAFWREVSLGEKLRWVTHGPQMRNCMGRFLGDAKPHDYMFLRPSRVGLSTRLHYDLPFFARGSSHILTAWMALGDIPIDEGPLVIVEGSHEFQDLIEPIRNIDYDSKDSPTVQIMEDTVEFVRRRGTRLLTANFQAGDVIVFGMTTLHGTCDNHSRINRVRLSCDVRWQPGADPVDPRYAGDNPPGTTGAGYGELNGAKPLVDDWHTR